MHPRQARRHAGKITRVRRGGAADARRALAIDAERVPRKIRRGDERQVHERPAHGGADVTCRSLFCWLAAMAWGSWGLAASTASTSNGPYVGRMLLYDGARTSGRSSRSGRHRACGFRALPRPECKKPARSHANNPSRQFQSVSGIPCRALRRVVATPPSHLRRLHSPKSRWIASRRDRVQHRSVLNEVLRTPSVLATDCCCIACTTGPP